MVRAFEFHVIGEIHDVDRALMDDMEFLQEAIVSSVVRAGLTIFDVYVHRQIDGLLGIGVIGESHVAVRTWISKGLITVEVSSCKDPESTWGVYFNLVKFFKGKIGYSLEIRTGMGLLGAVLEEVSTRSAGAVPYLAESN
ncbi:MAG: S-adenosylmethionine decarboxylase [Candidatus Methanodesulfokora sp.]